MNAAIRNIQLVAVVIVLVSTILAFLLEIMKMYETQMVTLADLLLMFIYIEVIGLVRSYWESRAVRVIYPLVISITALARYIILQDKESDPANLIYLAFAILIVSIATIVEFFSLYISIICFKHGILDLIRSSAKITANGSSFIIFLAQ